MAIYGEPELEIEYTFIAVRPLRAEHPIGSGTIVDYKPGDVIPAGEWGNAAHNLVEMGRAERLATNVATKAGGGSSGVTAAPVTAEKTKASDMTYPERIGGGWFILSNGERVRGEDAAAAAQAELDKEI